MGAWFEDFTENVLEEEIVGFEAENKRWGQSVRVRIKLAADACSWSNGTSAALP
jgi:hypothetical protein